MDLLINGELRDIEEVESLLSLLDQLHLKPENVVVEHNGEIPPKDHWENIMLKSGDRLEIVRFMGGG